MICRTLNSTCHWPVLQGGKPHDDLVEFAIVLVEFRADRTKHVEHEIGAVVYPWLLFGSDG
jgi:hypothetical protein